MPRDAGQPADAVTAFAPADYWTRSAPNLLAALGATADGLDADAAARRLARSGPNALRRRGAARWRELVHPFTSPIVLLLVAATLIAAAVGDVADAAIILAIVLLSGILGFVQEHRASSAIAALLASVGARARVRRDGRLVERPAAELVPGDVVRVATGDVVPADAVLLAARALQVDEASLTGESVPVDKAPGVAAPETPLARRSNCLFMGTHVAGGDGDALVVATGSRTELGRIAATLAEPAVTTGFERGVARFGGMLAEVMAVLVAVVFVANVALGRGLLEALLFSLALAVGLTPQLLPAIVSVSLASGARRMARRQVIVRRLDAIEDFGGIDVLCTDKTGTITEGVVRLVAALDAAGRPSAEVAALAYLNATLQSGFDNPIDRAIAASPPQPPPAAERLDEICLRLRAPPAERAAARRRPAPARDEGCRRGGARRVHARCDARRRAAAGAGRARRRRGALPRAERRRLSRAGARRARPRRAGERQRTPTRRA